MVQSITILIQQYLGLIPNKLKYIIRECTFIYVCNFSPSELIDGWRE